jgi:hypothetical protein
MAGKPRGCFNIALAPGEASMRRGAYGRFFEPVARREDSFLAIVHGRRYWQRRMTAFRFVETRRVLSAGALSDFRAMDQIVRYDIQFCRRRTGWGMGSAVEAEERAGRQEWRQVG